METLDQQLTKKILFLQRYQPESLVQIEKQLLLAQDEIIKLLATTKNKTVLKAKITELINEAFTTFEGVLINNDIPEITALSYAVVGNIMLDYSTGIKFKPTKKTALNKLKDPNIEVMGYKLEDHFNHLNYTTKRSLQGAIVNGFNQGEGIETISNNIRNIVGNVSRHQARTIARTTILNKIDEAQNEVFKEFEDVIIEYRYSATIDGRTSKVCTYMANRVYKKKEDAPYQPKNHWNCRSLWIPETEISKKLREENTIITQWDSKTVNHRDGTTSTKFKVDKTIKVPNGITGPKMFEYFDESYKKQYLGVTRYKLYKDGKATLTQMIDLSKNAFIPLNELKTKLKS